MSKLFVVVETQMLLRNSEIHIIPMAVILEIFVKLGIRALLAEGLELHLLKLNRSECEVARSNLISESLADLTDAERKLCSHAALYVEIVYILTLCIFRTQIDNALCVVRYSPVCLEHKVELSYVRKVVLAAVRTGNRMSLDVVKHLLFRHAVGVSIGVEVVYKVVGSVAHLALLAVKERIGEARNMTACLPNSRMHKDIRVNLVAVFSLLDETLSPCIFYIVFKPRAERTVVPCIGKSAVNIAARKNKASVFTKRNNLVHCLFSIR